MSEDVTTGSVPTEKELEEELLARTLAAEFFIIPPGSCTPQEFIGVFPGDTPPEMVKAIGEYYTLISQIYNLSRLNTKCWIEGAMQIFYEKKVDYSHIVPEGFGTLDCALVWGDMLHIFDFKYGKGQKIHAKDNTQLILYALGMMNYLKKRNNHIIREIGLHIIQPRLDHYSSLLYSSQDMVDWAEFLKAKAFFPPPPWTRQEFEAFFSEDTPPEMVKAKAWLHRIEPQ